jgi:hypothetical protein
MRACTDKKFFGGLAEWSKAAVLKTVEGLSPPKVRILSPPPYFETAPFGAFFLFPGLPFPTAPVKQAY